MSPSACRRLRSFDRLPRHTCRACEAHPAKFRYHGEVRADRDHELCFRCFRAVVDSLRVRMVETASAWWTERRAA
jgi:hypothetical protein